MFWHNLPFAPTVQEVSNSDNRSPHAFLITALKIHCVPE